MDIWQWTLTSEAVAPCFVRDVLDMRQSSDPGSDFFWLGYTPCRTVLLVGMVVAILVYDKRAIYTIDDGTAVIDCVLRHSTKALAPPSRITGELNAKPTAQSSSPKKRLDKVKVSVPTEPPSPVTKPGYPVRVVGKVTRHYESKQIHADSINLCASSLDEIAHLERVIELHKTKYSLPVPFVPPPRRPLHAPSPDMSTGGVDRSVFSALPSPRSTTTPYTLPALPHMPMPLQNRNRPPPSPAASSIASSTPSSPCKHISPVKPYEVPDRPKLRHPSRLHTRDLTANTFRLYVKHYMDNAPPPFHVPSWSSPSRSTRGNVTTPTKYTRLRELESEGDEATPRPRHHPYSNTDETEPNEHGEDGSTLAFTLSHLRRVPELALLASRVVRAETRRRNKVEHDKARNASCTASTSTSSRPDRRGVVAESPRKKMKRLFSWAVVKLYEEGSIVIWDGEVRPLPIPPPPFEEGTNTGRMWNSYTNTLGSIEPSIISTCASTSVLYNLSASASLYSHYHAPHGQDGKDGGPQLNDDADPAALSDPGADEEAYVPLNPRFLAGYVKEALGVLRRGRAGGGTQSVTAEELLRCMQRMDGRWARVGVWAVEEALVLVLRAG